MIVEDRGKVYLFEEVVCVVWVSVNEEVFKVLVNELIGWRIVEVSGKVNGVICGFKFNDEVV